jgi:hypothetical protein
VCFLLTLPVGKICRRHDAGERRGEENGILFFSGGAEVKE